MDSAFNSSGTPGCTDPLAENFDAEANIDDNSCTYRDCYQNQGYIIYQDGDPLGIPIIQTIL